MAFARSPVFVAAILDVGDCALLCRQGQIPQRDALDMRHKNS